MKALRTWFQQMGGALIACLLLALVVAPTLDTAICAGDGERASAASVQMSDQGVDADHQKNKSHDGGSDVCIHGHCHHASPALGWNDAQYSARDPVTSHTAPRNLGFPPSSAQDRLEEPPRA